MITFANLGQFGRLGNQLFQIASTLGIANKNGIECKLPPWDYSKYFPNYKADFTPQQHTEALNVWQEVVEPTFHYNDIVLDKGRNSNLKGYFQSEKYFSHIAEQIKTLFDFSLTINVNKSLLHTTKSSRCAVHVRRGDYVANPDYYQLTLNYYAKAMRFVQSQVSDVCFYVFSDDIEWCKKYFKEFNHNIEYCEGGTDIEDLCSMTKCKHFICANSSFSWWAAWLGEQEGSVIIFPDKWMDGELAKKCNSKDIVPNRWHKGAPGIEKIDLRDVTFTIPVMYDHLDRRENLDLCISFLQKHFETNIVVGEWGKINRFYYVKDYCTYTHFDSDGPFHRTKMLNQMAMYATTPIVVNYDADVFFDPIQLLKCVDKIRQQKAHMCYPYDGRFYRVERKYIDLLKDSLEVAAFLPIDYPEIMHKEISYGGAVVWNKDAFIKCGMENENMVSFGPEDYERKDRAVLLGYVVDRVSGPLFHINHYVGVDSTKNNPYFKSNWDEYEKLKQLPEHRLTEYIESWPWRVKALEQKPHLKSDKEKYDPTFFAQINETAMKSADIIFPYLRSIIKFKNVLDVGCGQGAWGLNFQQHEYMGIDGDYVKPEQLLIDKSQFLAKDLSKKFNLKKKFGLVISLEVAEHIAPQHADVFIDNLCRHGDTILFSAAIPGQGGNGHLNEQWQSYWGRKFDERGYKIYDVIRHYIWDEKDIPYYYKQNMFLYSKAPIEIYSAPVIDCVHPDKYKQLLGV